MLDPRHKWCYGMPDMQDVVTLTKQAIDHTRSAATNLDGLSTAIDNLRYAGFSWTELINAILNGAGYLYHGYQAGQSWSTLIDLIWNAINQTPTPVEMPVQQTIPVRQQIPAQLLARVELRQPVMVPQYRSWLLDN